MPKVHMHKSGEFGMFVNAYAVETEKSLVAIDTTFTVANRRQRWQNRAFPTLALGGSLLSAFGRKKYETLQVLLTSQLLTT